MIDPEENPYFGQWKMPLLIVNYTRRQIYDLGEVRPGETYKVIIVYNPEQVEDPALHYLTIMRLLFAIRGDEIKIFWEDETDGIREHIRELLNNGFSIFDKIEFNDLPYIEGEKDNSSYRVADMKPD